MESGLPSEFSSFCSLTKKLRAILQETRRCFKEINGIGRYEEGSKYEIRFRLSHCESGKVKYIIASHR